MATSFEQAAADVRKLTKRPTDEEALLIYGLYKQATVGDINISQPWAVQMEARSKWDAWNANKGMSQEEAKEKYITAANQLIAKYS